MTEKQLISRADKAFSLSHWKEAYNLYHQLESQIVNGHVYYRCGLLYQNGYGTPKDEKMASIYFKKALEQLPALADGGDSEAQSDLGFMYDNGYGVDKDQAIALYYYRLAADAGVTRAQNNVGCYYYEGIIVEKDKAIAAKYFKLAADNHNAGAQCSLASMYDDGDGVPKDQRLALKYYSMAAEQGYCTAQFNLAFMYSAGEGTEINKQMALKFYKLATEQGDLDAMWTVANMYEKGDGITIDYQMAIKFFKHCGTKKATKHLYEIYRGIHGESYQAALIDYLLVQKWPKSHSKLNPNCKHAITTIVLIMKHMENPSHPVELIFEIVKKVIAVWPETHPYPYSGNLQPSELPGTSMWNEETN